MAEDSDQKTEAPSGKRLAEAREKGQVVSSREVNTWFLLATATLVIFIVAGPVMSRLTGVLRIFIEQPDRLATDPGGLGAVLVQTVSTVAMIVAIPIAMLFVGSLLGPLLQTGIMFTVEPLIPSFSRISPLAGLKRLFSLRSVVELLKGLLKLVVIGTVMVLPLLPMGTGMASLVGMEPAQMLDTFRGLALRMVGGALGVITVIAIADYAFQRFEFMQQMRMTKQEMKEELRQSEGDPMVRGRLRQIRMERARRRMMQAVPKADVVVTNPTHFAVAMKYDADQMAAPVVVAKGSDLIALAIRRLADEHGVTIVENPPLARALFASVEIDQEIPPEHYRAVAEIISYVFRLKRAGAPA